MFLTLELYFTHPTYIKCVITASLKPSDNTHSPKVWALCFKVSASYYKRLIKGKALRKHSLHEKTAASVLLKLYISLMNNATPLTPPSA